MDKVNQLIQIGLSLIFSMATLKESKRKKRRFYNLVILILLLIIIATGFMVHLG